MVRCGCRQRQPRPPSPAQAAVCSGPPARAGNQRGKILAALIEAGPAGVLNIELYKICLRPPSRIFELRWMGYTIRTIREGDSRFRFVLIAEPVVPKALPTFQPRPKATDQEQPPLFSEVGR